MAYGARDQNNCSAMTQLSGKPQPVSEGRHSSSPGTEAPVLEFLNFRSEDENIVVFKRMLSSTPAVPGCHPEPDDLICGEVMKAMNDAVSGFVSGPG